VVYFPILIIDTECRWLLVLDNIDEMLYALPPSGSAGSVLITSRNFNICSNITATSFEVQPFNSETSVSALLSFVGQKDCTDSERASAAEITQALGGLPLAIKQVSGFIVQQRLNLEGFQLYKRNSIFDQMLRTIWERAISQLSGPPLTLQTLLSFLDPNGVHESVLYNGSESLLNIDFAFLEDEMRYVSTSSAS
jgi:hypothetical protein